MKREGDRGSTSDVSSSTNFLANFLASKSGYTRSADVNER